MNQSAEQYRTKRMQAVMPYIAELPLEYADIHVIIPAVNEFPLILKTIKSLHEAGSYFYNNPIGVQKRVHVTIVVNNRKSHSDDVKRNSHETAAAIADTYPMFCTVIDCYSPGRELPEKDGAGFARKIGLDYAYLCACSRTHTGEKGIIACMDADTLVDTDYFTAIAESFCSRVQAGLTGFKHRLDGSEEQNTIITAYENYLLEHARRLKKAGSPWYPVALGPTLVCTAHAYAASGGMSRRLAGEDFYFLQMLLKTCAPHSFCRIPTTVYPSARVSDRVPFGTGVAVKGTIEGTYTINDFSEESFLVLKQWIVLAGVQCQNAVSCGSPCTDDFMNGAQKTSAVLYDFLKGENFGEVWVRLYNQNRKNPQQLLAAFHCWFDGLKTIRMFHALMQ